MNDLGNLESTIKPNLQNYFLFSFLGAVVVAVAVFFPNYFENWVLIGIPAVFVAYIAGPLVMIYSIIYYLQGKKANENIELYENGIRIGDFASQYTELSVRIKTGALNKILIFQNGIEKKKFKFHIKPKEITLITNKLK